MLRSADLFTISHGLGDAMEALHRFPPGPCLFLANPDAVAELHTALYRAFRATVTVTPAQLTAWHELELNAETLDDILASRAVESPKFAIDDLRTFLVHRRPSFDATVMTLRSRITSREVTGVARALGVSEEEITTALGVTVGEMNEVTTVRANSLRYAAARLDYLRELGSSDLLVDATIEAARHLLRSDWSPTIPIGQMEPQSAIMCAAGLDRGAWQKLPDINSDLSELALCAVQCCIAPDAESLPAAPWLAELVWTDLGEPDVVDRSEGMLGSRVATDADSIVVRPNLSTERVERLAFTEARGLTLIAVTLPCPEE